MTEQPDSEAGESPIAQSTVPHGPPPGHFLKSENEDATLDPDDVEDESDGMEKPDFLGKTNLENRDE